MPRRGSSPQVSGPLTSWLWTSGSHQKQGARSNMTACIRASRSLGRWD